MEVRLIILTIFLLTLPALGAALAGQPLALYFEYPPVSHLRIPPTFSWVGFLLMALLFTASAALAVNLAFGPSVAPQAQTVPRRPLPWWGWAGAGLVGMALAGEMFSTLNTLWGVRHFALLLGYLLLMTGFARRRGGHCLLLERPAYFLALFPVSSLVWWYLEYLNRYVQNWHFVEDFTPLGYLLQCSLAFAPLIPAVVATRQWLATFPHLMARLHTGRSIARHHIEPTALLLLTLSVLGLMGAGAWPSTFFPLLWLAPMFLITAFQLLSGEPTLFIGIRRGDWSRVVLPAVAALPVALVLQLANWAGQPQWVYDLPLLQRFEVLGLPLIGYAAYLPFGILALQVADIAAQPGPRRRPYPMQSRIRPKQD